MKICKYWTFNSISVETHYLCVSFRAVGDESLIYAATGERGLRGGVVVSFLITYLNKAYDWVEEHLKIQVIAVILDFSDPWA